MARTLGMAAVILGLIAGAYWKLALPHPTTVWFDHYDMCQLEIPRLQFLARNLHAGNFPLWDPHTWAGLPVLGSAQPGPVYPLNLLFALAPLENGLLSIATLNWLFIAMHFLAAGFFPGRLISIFSFDFSSTTFPASTSSSVNFASRISPSAARLRS